MPPRGKKQIVKLAGGTPVIVETTVEVRRYVGGFKGRRGLT